MPLHAWFKIIIYNIYYKFSIIKFNAAEESAIMMVGVRKTEGADAYTTLFPCLWLLIF